VASYNITAKPFAKMPIWMRKIVDPELTRYHI